MVFQDSTKVYLRLLAISLVALIGLGVSSSGHCREWVRYENEHFITYSRARAKKVKALVQELELFRAAALQVYRVRAPQNAPKTLVIITKNRGEFEKFGGEAMSVGFAHREGKRTLIVIPSSGSSNRNRRVARHEYAHALLTFENFAYPSWYDEGFAELAALIEIDEKNGTFALGLSTERVLGSREMAIDWDRLVSSDFDPHQLNNWMSASAAYGQSWLLLHYLLLGPDESNAKKLAFYVANLKEGMRSIDAFNLAFEKTPNEMWLTEMQDYTSRLPYFTIKFEGLTLDKAFDTSPAPPAEIQPLIDFLMAPTIGANAKVIKGLPESYFTGFWAKPKFDSTCENLIKIEYDEEADVFNIKGERNEKTLEESVLYSYSYQKHRKGNLILSRINLPQGEQPTPDFKLSPRENDILCISGPEAKDYQCSIMIHRCELPN